jgi:hypothetical protein
MELADHLEKNCQDQYLYGLCRVAFGAGKLRRSYCFEVSWTGPKVSGVQAIRAKAESQGFLDDKMGDNAFTINSTCAEDIQPESVIDQIKKNCVVDGDANSLTVVALIEAWDAEQKALKEYYAEMERLKKEGVERAELERLAKEKAEEQRKQEEEEAAKRAAALLAAKAAADSDTGAAAVAESIRRVIKNIEDSWMLFEIKI